jgi:tRNA-modifying protein YgfZ
VSEVIHRVDLGTPAVLEFRGPDAVRFLNGQLTQDVRRVVGSAKSLPSCVTDAKGKLQFRVSLLAVETDALWVTGLQEWSENLEARLTRYLIADDVEVADLTASYRLVHFMGEVPPPPQGVISREANRFGIAGTDWWIPFDQPLEYPAGTALLEGDALEAVRISNGVPAWGSELVEGMLPPEALLEATDISYSKGCYIGQEVISRIKSAGKVNKRLVKLHLPPDITAAPIQLVDANGQPAGTITSISSKVENGIRPALGYLKRGVDEVFVAGPDGNQRDVKVL